MTGYVRVVIVAVVSMALLSEAVYIPHRNRGGRTRDQGHHRRTRPRGSHRHNHDRSRGRQGPGRDPARIGMLDPSRFGSFLGTLEGLSTLFLSIPDQNSDVMSATLPRFSGPNVCVEREERIENRTESNPFTYISSIMRCESTDSGQKCMSRLSNGTNTRIITWTMDCCHGYARVRGKRGCPKALELKSLLETAQDVGLSEAVRAINSIGLHRTISRGNYTLFLPSDEAFKELVPPYGVQADAAADSLKTEVVIVNENSQDIVRDMREILTSHVVDGFVKSATFRDGMTLDTVNPDGKININKLLVNRTEKFLTANCAKIVSTDTQATNGIIHVIDKVLRPSTDTLMDIINRHPELSSFKSMLSRWSEFPRMLKEPGHYTVFAPTNEAFAKMPVSLRNKLIQQDNRLKAVMDRHISERFACAIDVDREDFGDVEFVEVDILGLNGVLHLIDDVLIPDEALDVMDIAEKAGATILVGLIEAAGLTDRLKGLDNITLFMPSNQAFEKLSPDSLDELANRPEDLEKIILFHVAQSRVTDKRLEQLRTITSMDDQNDIRVTKQRQCQGRRCRGRETYEILLECGTLSGKEMVYSNGIARTINKVMLPPTGDIMDTLSQSGNFSTLLRLINQSGLSTTLREERLKTMFAPTDEAFAAMEPSSMDRLTEDPERLQALLKTHITEEGILCCESMNRRRGVFHRIRSHVRTLSGKSIPLSRDEHNVPTADNVRVTSCDLMATNGVIHVIDDVIRPRRPIAHHFGYLEDLFGDISDMIDSPIEIDFEFDFGEF